MTHLLGTNNFRGDLRWSTSLERHLLRDAIGRIYGTPTTPAVQNVDKEVTGEQRSGAVFPTFPDAVRFVAKGYWYGHEALKALSRKIGLGAR